VQEEGVQMEIKKIDDVSILAIRLPTKRILMKKMDAGLSHKEV
jgi:hypothetical protein